MVFLMQNYKLMNLCLHIISMQRRKVSEGVPENPTDSLTKATSVDSSTNKGV